MSKRPFAKFQGSGNDFILFDDRDSRFPLDDFALIRKLCHRQYGIGADGVILLCRPSKENADFRMRIFNSDGREVESCGNGLLCLIRYLRDLGEVQKNYRIETQEKIVAATLARGQPVIDMGPPEKMRFEVATDWGVVHCVDTGVPHAVQFVEEVELVDLPTAGGSLRRHLNANVNFAALEANGSIRVRTYERGVEGETLSCGTGAAAVFSIASRLYGLKGKVSLHFRGGKLEAWEEEGRLFLTGPAEKVFTGTLS